MQIDVLASGSDGNAYRISDGTTNLLLDCGIPFSSLKVKLNFFNPKIHGCLVSHSHQDHAKAVEYLMYYGIDCYMSADTINELYIGNSNRAKTIQDREKFQVGTFEILPLLMRHDVTCLGFLIYSTATKESVFFATDTYYIPYKIPPVDYIMVEANYSLERVNQRINDGDTNMEHAKPRLMKSHMEINNTLLWLSKTDLSKTKRIYLLHLSAFNSAGNEFQQRVIEQTGIPTTIAKGE